MYPAIKDITADGEQYVYHGEWTMTVDGKKAPHGYGIGIWEVEKEACHYFHGIFKDGLLT